MRIAILTSARTGSTSLFHLIESHLNPNKNYVSISEPFNNYWRDKMNLKTYSTKYFEEKSDIFIKTFVSKLQIPNEFNGDYEKYWNWFFITFDKVILLDRRNKTLQSESLTYHMKKDNLTSWQKRQFYDLSNITKEEIQSSYDVLLNESKILNELSERGYPIYYYEDIYIDKNKKLIEDIFEYIGIELKTQLYDKEILFDNNKIRITEQEIKNRNLI